MQWPDGILTKNISQKGMTAMAKRKNMLLILADQQRLDTVSAYGMNQICKTPHIDQLAAEGMKFNNAAHELSRGFYIVEGKKMVVK